MPKKDQNGALAFENAVDRNQKPPAEQKPNATIKSGEFQPHNANKESLGPNTKR